MDLGGGHAARSPFQLIETAQAVRRPLIRVLDPAIGQVAAIKTAEHPAAYLTAGLSARPKSLARRTSSTAAQASRPEALASRYGRASAERYVTWAGWHSHLRVELPRLAEEGLNLAVRCPTPRVVP